MDGILDGGMDLFISRGKDGRHCCNYDSTISMRVFKISSTVDQGVLLLVLT